jgi:hypothetical protein
VAGRGPHLSLRQTPTSPAQRRKLGTPGQSNYVYVLVDVGCAGVLLSSSADSMLRARRRFSASVHTRSHARVNNMGAVGDGIRYHGIDCVMRVGGSDCGLQACST